ncbi:MAG: aminotransferase class V-fold PLP-dependent enzyme [Flavobacteriaceae bacterium]|nr:aminotransferase class V-fold PLP-dependent enzyme [Flavobacteriaceae bacterium]
MDKRTFLKRAGQSALAASVLGMPWEGQAATPCSEPYPEGDDEAFWKRIRMDYALKPDYINLENGYYNFVPTPILNKFIENVRMVNYEASYYMRTVQWQNKDTAASRLASLIGCPADSLIITRNTTESLDMVIGGYPWQKGDEAIYALQDYGAMRDHFRQIKDRYGVVCKEVSVPNHPESDEALVALYESQISKKTKLLMNCHMVNITGQILPVRKICDMAHSYGVEVLVDGAHCVGHIPVDIAALGCDYFGSSLHKWLSVPLGSGLLYVDKKHIGKIWPLLADHVTEADNIKRLNHTGTHPVHTDLTIHDAIDYLELIGLERKERRLRFIQRYWSDKLREVPNVVINTPVDPQRSCGIANVGIKGLKPSEMAKTLLESFGVWTVAIDYANVKGCRITPNVYTTTDELDRFVSAVTTMAAKV